MDKKLIAWILIVAGAIATFLPQLQTGIAVGDSRIIGMIALVGGVILYYLPTRKGD